MKITCTNPGHEDRNASMEVYEDGGFCFVCNWVDKSITDTDVTKTSPEDISDTLGYISTLPKKLIRGLELPYDLSGYFIVWPDNSFYKKRLWEGNTRYIAPRGHKPPLFEYPVKHSDTLVILEGELNCLSLYHSIPKSIVTLTSPGSAGEFSKAIDYCGKFYRIYAILDKDPAGVAAGVDLKRKMLKLGKRIELICITKDYNDVLQEEGKQGVKAAFCKHLGLS